MIFVILVIFVLIYFYYTPIEHFTNFSTFVNKKISDNITIVPDHYLDFLQNVKDNSIDSSDSPFKTFTIETQKKALDTAFKMEPNENPIEQATIKELTDSTTPKLYTTDQDTCIVKADNLCQHTNPYQFLVDAKNTRNRWEKESIYKNEQLAKETNLTCWNKMYNCCTQNKTRSE